MHSYTLVIISNLALLLLCEAAVTAEKDTATATISHKVHMTYTSAKDRDAKLRALLNRWKTILAQPDFGQRTATGIELSSERPLEKGHLVVYEVVYRKTNKQDPTATKSKATAALDKLLKQQPINGVSAASGSRTRLRSLMAFDVLE